MTLRLRILSGLPFLVTAFGLGPQAVMAQSVELTQQAPFVQRLSTEGGLSVVVPNCGLTSSETGGFAMPRPDAPPLIGLICAALDGGRRLHVFSADDLSELYRHEGGEAMTVTLLMQGLLHAEGDEIVIWDAPDGHFGSNRFRHANGEASGIRMQPGDVLAPRLHARDYALALHAREPLRLGPAHDAPFFDRASDHLLVHLPEGEADGFWRVDGFARVCIPDSGCGYVPADRITAIPTPEADPVAREMMQGIYGPRDEELQCWRVPMEESHATEEGMSHCLRPQFLADGLGARGQGWLAVAAGPTMDSNNWMSRCHACSAGLAVIHRDDDGILRHSGIHEIGSWGRGPSASDLRLIGAETGDWRLVAADTYNDRGTLLTRYHVFGPLDGAPVLLGVLPGEVVTPTDAEAGVWQEVISGYHLSFHPDPEGRPQPLLSPADGSGAPMTIQPDPETGRYPPIDWP